VAQTRRILFAKQLIDETHLSMSQLALAAGFASTRRFNAAMRQSYGVAPRELRRSPGPARACDDRVDVCLKLSYRPPFDWDAIVAFLAARAIPRVESVSPKRYRRSITTPNGSGLVEVEPGSYGNHLLARIHINEPLPLEPIAARIRRIFDLAADPLIIAGDLGQSNRLRQAVRAAPGMRVPGAWSGFELAVRAILGQQVSVKGATTLCGRLVEHFGTPSRLRSDGLDFLFPSPAVLAGADLTAVGLPRTRAAAIAALAAAVDSGALDLETPRSLELSLAQLKSLPGIGEWTAQYIAMRALREPDAFPASDLGLRRALGRNGAPLSERELVAMADAWRPWRAYAAMLLWSGAARRHRRGDRGSRSERRRA
jgi:AraC family transcriptional regulator of adaptative response / DNA-3-methyladenine glycosylase II